MLVVRSPHKHTPSSKSFTLRQRIVQSNIWQSIPGTPAFRRYASRQIIKSVRHRMWSINQIDILDAKTKLHLRNYMQFYYRYEETRRFFVHNVFQNPRFLLLPLLGIVFLYIVLINLSATFQNIPEDFLRSWFHVNYIVFPPTNFNDLLQFKFLQFNTTRIIATITLGVILVIAIFPLYFIRPRMKSNIRFSYPFYSSYLFWPNRINATGPSWLAATTLLCYILISFLLTTPRATSIDETTFAIITGLLYDIITLSLSIPVLLLVIRISITQHYQFTYRWSVKALTDNLLCALFQVELHKKRPGTLLYTRNALAFIEIASRLIERDIPNVIATQDLATDLWFRDVTTQIAAAWREKKKWILTPKIDTDAYLCDILAANVMCIIQGEWDALERQSPEAIPTSEVWRVRIVGAIRTLFLAFAPLGVLGFVQATSLAPVGTLRDTAVVVAIIWAMVTLVLAFDSRFSDKITALKDISGLLTLGGGKGP
ncbi:MAG: hypothetical protein M3Z04_22340 [Chloroflexota bacterium]|nr:hypothetical protein [Chloroflexota bacterium]